MENVVSEYGSEFDWNSNIEYISGDFNEINYDKEHYFRSGRDCLRAIAKKYKYGYKRVLMPALCCNSMVEPFKENGYEVVYFKLNKDLTYNLKDILLKINGSTVFVYINYFGCKALTDEQLKQINMLKKNIVFIEDKTHELKEFKENYICNGKFYPNYTLCSVRKWLAIPDGGILHTRESNEIFLMEKDEYFSQIRKAALKIKSDYLKVGDIKLKNKFRDKLLEANYYLEIDKKIRSISESSIKILRQIDLDKILDKRNHNSNIISKKLESIKEVKYICKNRETGSLYYPILIKDRDRVQEKLAHKSIYCPVIWPLPEDSLGICETSEHIANNMLALPCDHRYSEYDINYICEVLKSLVEGM